MARPLVDTRSLVLFIACSLGASMPEAQVAADIIRVPGEVPTIQGAINAAEDGDVVLIAPGVYPERLNLSGKRITVIGEEYMRTTIVDAQGLGPALTCASGETRETIIRDLQFINGVRSGSGGGAVIVNSSPTIEYCWFIDHLADGGSGGAMQLRDSDAWISKCVFQDNTARGGDGGAIVVRGDGSPTIINSTFYDNRSESGAGGAIANRGQSKATIMNCLIEANQAQSGGGITNLGGSAPRIVNCTIVENLGGGVVNRNRATPMIANSIIWGNEGGSILSLGSSRAEVGWSDVEGGHPGPGNIDADPLFDAGNRPTTDSPCLDAGHSGFVEQTFGFDKHFLPRLVDDPAPNTGGGAFPFVDMGAIERQDDRDIQLVAYGSCLDVLRLEVRNATPNGLVLIVTAPEGGAARIADGHPCAGLVTGLASAGEVVVRAYADEFGSLDIETNGFCLEYGQALDVESCTLSRVLTLSP
ncbi:MAG: right-handed parallel beta-helix repeat-containing protein [Phycisphaerales bacterium]